jgi:hypothetical protein
MWKSRVELSGVSFYCLTWRPHLLQACGSLRVGWSEGVGGSGESGVRVDMVVKASPHKRRAWIGLSPDTWIVS